MIKKCLLVSFLCISMIMGGCASAGDSFSEVYQYYMENGVETEGWYLDGQYSYFKNGAYLIGAIEENETILFAYAAEDHSEKVMIELSEDMTANISVVIMTEAELVEAKTCIEVDKYQYGDTITNFEYTSDQKKWEYENFESRAGWLIRNTLLYMDVLLSNIDDNMSLVDLGFSDYKESNNQDYVIDLKKIAGEWHPLNKDVWYNYTLHRVDEISSYDPILNALYVITTEEEGEVCKRWIYSEDGKMFMRVESLNVGMGSERDSTIYEKCEGEASYMLEIKSVDDERENIKAPTTGPKVTGQASAQYQNNTDTITFGERNALATARDYLKVMPFSYAGLLEQLEYEGYTNSEATYAADHCGANWNYQATEMAKGYLEVMPFSRNELIEQLEYEGFTHAQAVYGAEHSGY